jgi:hypothetical protein
LRTRTAACRLPLADADGFLATLAALTLPQIDGEFRLDG